MPNLWEDNIFGKVRNQDWIDVGALPPARQNDPVDGLFGDIKTDNIVAYYESIASEYSIPVMAQFHGFDTESKTTFRVPIDTHNVEKGLIKVKINQSERLRALTRAGVQGDQKLYNYVLQDGIRLADQVVTRTKVAKNELLATGKVTIKENNLDLTVDYGVPAGQTGYTLDFSEEADIPSQIQNIVDDALDKGVVLSGMVTSRKNISKMRKNKYIQTAINGVSAAGQLVSATALNSYLLEEFGIGTVVTNDLRYGADAVIDSTTGRPSITQKRYYPENKVTFFSTNMGGKLGTGLWGDPPEIDAGRFYQVGGSEVSPYVYLMQWMETDPAVLWTKASSLFIPVLYNPNSLFIATVADSFLDALTITPEDQGNSVFGVPVSSIQGSNLAVSDGKVTGTSKYISSGVLADDWGPGNFIALKWSDPDATATSLKVGLEPSAGTGLVECITDADRNGVFKITNKNVQKFKAVSSNAQHSRVQYLDLSSLTLEGAS